MTEKIMSELLQDAEKYRLQRNALLEACKEIAEGIRYIKGILPDEMKKPYQKLLAAIALAEGKE